MSRRLVISTFSLALAAAWLAPPAAAASTPTCDGHRATLVGRQFNVVLTGTSGPDVIVALGGRETVESGGGDDIICLLGHQGRADGGAGHDLLIGSRFTDVLAGGPGRDIVRGRVGSDVLTGGRGDDMLFGGRLGGGDWFIADPGDDTWVAGWRGGGVDEGSSGITEFDFGLLANGVTSGVDVDLSGPISKRGMGHGTADGPHIGHDTLRFPEGLSSVMPSVIGTNFDDTFVGGAEADTFDSGGGADQIHGRGGDDDLNLEGDPAHPSAGEGLAHIRGGAGSDTLRLIDTSVHARLYGGGGNDRIYDIVEDAPFVPTNAHLDGGDGSDLIVADISLDGDVALGGGPGADSAEVGIHSPADASPYGTVTVNLAAGTITTTDGLSVPATGLENLSLDNEVEPSSLVTAYDVDGTDGPNTIQFFSATVPTTIDGLGGDDVLAGGLGDDTLDGGLGTDTGDGSGGVNTCVSIEVATNCS